MNKVTVTPIRTDSDYEASLLRLEELIDAEPGTPEFDELDVLATLLERFEEVAYPIGPPTPLEAIHFRMEQQNLTARDLIPVLGSRARVSEVLNGTRSLSLDMIRALNRHLDIPAESLLGEDHPTEAVRELSKPVENILKSWGFLKAGEGLQSLLARAFGGSPALVMLRQTRTDRTNVKTDPAAMQAWCASALLRSSGTPVPGPFRANRLGVGTLRTLARLSVEDGGPCLAKEALSDLGISLVVLPHLPGTHLDGAAMLRSDGTPVIAMTLRRDQIDGFWFTLLHEVAHVWKHLDAERPAILDDLEIGSSTAIEREADRIAQNALIPPALWDDFNKGEYTSIAEVVQLAEKAGVHPAVVAARWRLANRNYRKFSRILGHGLVRMHFPEWRAL